MRGGVPEIAIAVRESFRGWKPERVIPVSAVRQSRRQLKQATRQAARDEKERIRVCEPTPLLDMIEVSEPFPANPRDYDYRIPKSLR